MLLMFRVVFYILIMLLGGVDLSPDQTEYLTDICVGAAAGMVNIEAPNIFYYEKCRGKTIGQTVLLCRNSLGLSQKKLAEKAQVNVKTIQRTESGRTKPRLKTLLKLERALGVPVGFLSGNEVPNCRYQVFHTYIEKLSLAEKQRKDLDDVILLIVKNLRNFYKHYMALTCLKRLVR